MGHRLSSSWMKLNLYRKHARMEAAELLWSCRRVVKMPPGRARTRLILICAESNAYQADTVGDSVWRALLDVAYPDAWEQSELLINRR